MEDSLLVSQINTVNNKRCNEGDRRATTVFIRSLNSVFQERESRKRRKLFLWQRISMNTARGPLNF